MDMYGCRINAESQDVSQCCLARRSKASYSLNVAIIEAGRGDSPGPKPNGVREIVELIRACTGIFGVIPWKGEVAIPMPMATAYAVRARARMAVVEGPSSTAPSLFRIARGIRGKSHAKVQKPRPQDRGRRRLQPLRSPRAASRPPAAAASGRRCRSVACWSDCPEAVEPFDPLAP